MSHLLLRVVDGDGSADPVHDVVAEIAPGQTAADLSTAIATHLGLGSGPWHLRIERTGRVAAPEVELDDIDLLSGDEVTIGRVLTSQRRSRVATGWSLDIVAGPDSGRSYPLGPGVVTVGRSSCADIILDDRSVSRRHATLTIGDECVVLRAGAGAANGVSVDGAPLPPGEPIDVDGGAVLAFGSTRAVVRRNAHDRPSGRVRLGQVEFHRTPYRPPKVTEHDIAPVGPIPIRPRPRRHQLIAVLAPLVAGVGMYALTRQAQFLLFTLISPAVMIGTAVDDRRHGRRTFDREVSEFRAMLSARHAELEVATAREAGERHRAAPDLAQLVRRAGQRSLDLWQRGRDTPDTGWLRLGLGEDAAGYSIELEAGGDDGLRAEAEATLAGVKRLVDVPVTVDVTSHALGVHGSTDLVAGVAASLVVQAATLHSPDDLTIVAGVSPCRRLDWMKWLPHLRSVTSPVDGDHLVHDRSGIDALVARLLEVAEFRTSGDHHRRGLRWPRVFAVLDASLDADAAAVARLLDLAVEAGIGVVWLADEAARVPRQIARVLAVEHSAGARMAGRLWATDPAVPERHVDVEHLRPGVADRVARELAPLRDASSASRASAIPRVVPLLDILGLGDATPGAVVERWSHEADRRLVATIGVDAGGPLSIDLVSDGPHALVGGTSGAGKSELVQSMVASLAADQPPSRLNFLFVDYKGGAATQVFGRLPHTVGYVTNLSADLARRALTSLRAELQRRMALLEGRAKDLDEMLALYPDEAPASLVIVVDEFATLVKEVPEFVAGVVDIAQRGRSLGIHLVLATQRPSGAVDDDILANTNLRIALRMLDRSESSAVIGSPDAADIPVPLRGRAFVRRGPGRLVEFQGAFGGAPLAEPSERQVLVGEFTGPGSMPCAAAVPARSTRSEATTTHLDAVLDLVGAAGAAWGGPPPRRPWREVLPDVVTLDDVSQPCDEAAGDPRACGEAAAGRDVVIGMLDAPEQQEQRPAVVDLEASGGLLVYGSGGAGKTTLLRSIAAGVERSRGRAATLVIDFASRGLTPLRDLPSVVDVVNGDDLEAATRHLLVLDAELDRRRRLLAEARAEHLSAYRAGPASSAPLERIVVLIDGFGALASALLESGGSLAAADRWSDVVLRIVTDGRQLGVHTVIASDRRASVPPRLQSAIGARLVLRHADPQAYTDLGVSAERAEVLGLPGRALLDDTTVQLACVSADPSARAQAAAVAGLAARSSGPRTDVLASAALPREVSPADVASGRPGAIGLADIHGAEVVLDISWSHAVVVGPPRSGRSTAVAAAARALAVGHEVYAVGPTSSPLAAAGVAPADRLAFGPAAAGALLDRVANLAVVGPDGPLIAVCVDDLDVLDDTALEPVWQRLLGAERVRLVAAVETRAMAGYTTSSALTELRRSRRMLVMQPDDPTEFLQLTGVKLPVRPGLRWPPGRAVLLADRQPTVLQVADALRYDDGCGDPAAEPTAHEFALAAGGS